MQNKNNRFVEARDGEIKMLVDNAVPRNTKESIKYAVNVFQSKESYELSLRLV